MRDNSNIKFILQTLKPFKFWILAQFVICLLWAIDLSLRPYILKIIINKIPQLSAADVVQQLQGPVITYLAISFFIVIVFRLYDFVWLNLNPPLKRHVGDKLMKKMMGHSLLVFHNHFAGNLSNKIKEVMSGVPDLLKIFLQQFLTQLIALIIAIFVVSTIHYQFSILLFSWLIFFITVTLLFSIRAKKLCLSAAEVRSNVMGQLVDILSNIASIHLFAGRKIESNGLMKHLDNYVRADQKRDWWFLAMHSVQGLSFVIYQALCFLLLIHYFKQGYISAGDFSLIISINVAIVNVLWTLSTDILKAAELLGNISQGLKIALAPLDLPDQQNAPPLQIARGKIVFEDVHFHYETEALFQNKSVTIEAGQKVGLVGYSGSGKTTFVNLILRLYDVTDGRILIDDQDIRHVTQDSLRTNIAMIPQDPSLFNRSLMENIRYGKADASDRDIITAAKRAHAHEFIKKMPLGYHTPVGERGIKLSGGQRQRISIARAILKNAPILILDEATSALDSVIEYNIQASLWELMHGKTTIVIAHRLSTLLHMDRIIVFDQGKIVEEGSHSALLSKNGFYKTLWDAQIGGFLPDDLTER